MKIATFFLPILFLLITCSELEEEDRWSMVRDQVDDITYKDIHFANDNDGWIVGDNGTIQHTCDGGENWQTQSSGVSSKLWGITFVSKDLGWACGTNGTLLKTEDGGETWITLLAGDTLDGIYVSLAFTDENYGWLSNNNGSILRTTDGGLSWDLRKKHSSGGSRLSAFDPLTLYNLHGRLYRTLDGGLNWDSVEVAEPDNYSSSNMYFPDKDHGFISMINGTGGMIITHYPLLMTTDSGQSWQESDFLDAEGFGFTCLYFIDNNIGWLAGMKHVYKTIDGGHHWTLDYYVTHVGAKDIHFIDENHGWIVNYTGQVFKYTNN